MMDENTSFLMKVKLLVNRKKAKKRPQGAKQLRLQVMQ
jgi:hypothetical protein